MDDDGLETGVRVFVQFVLDHMDGIEGMACPGGCVAGAGTLLPVELAANVVGRYQKEADTESPLESPYRDKAESLD